MENCIVPVNYSNGVSDYISGGNLSVAHALFNPENFATTRLGEVELLIKFYEFSQENPLIEAALGQTLKDKSQRPLELIEVLAFTKLFQTSQMKYRYIMALESGWKSPKGDRYFPYVRTTSKLTRIGLLLVAFGWTGDFLIPVTQI